MRLHVSLPIGPEASASLQGWIDALAGRHRAARWTRSGQLHITLKFLGEISVDRLDSIVRALSRAASLQRCFDYRITQPGAFPDEKRARIAWAGVELGQPDIRSVAAAVEDALFEEGLSRETRPYLPHVTLGRLARPSNIARELQALREQPEGFPPPCRAAGFTLFESVLEAAGARYKALKKFDWPEG